MTDDLKSELGSRGGSGKSLRERSRLRENSANSNSDRGEGARSVIESAVIFATGTALSRILGLVRDILIARYFTIDIRDAFINAFRLPNLFRRIFGEGAISASFIPVFLEVISGRELAAENETELRTKQLLAGVFSILLAVVSTISILAVIFMEELLRMLLAGAQYMDVPGKFELTVRLGRIMFAFLILISVFSYFMAILNALRKFMLSAIAPCFFNLCLIAVALLSTKASGNPMLLAWGVLIGGLAQVLVVTIGVLRSGYFPRLTTAWENPDVLRVLQSILPAVLGLSVLQLNAIVNMRFASDLPPGSHSYLYLADRIFELPLSLFVVSIGAALLPTLARNWSAGDKTAMSETINHYARVIVFVALPAAVGMFVLAQPIAEVLFLGREFKYDDAFKTSQIIQVYSFGLILSAGVRILAQGFYAIQSVWFPAGAALVALISHVILAFALTRTFGLTGLAGSTVLSSGINLLMLGFAYNAWVGRLEFRNFFVSLAKFIVCCLVMVVALQIYGPFQRFVGAARPGSRAFVLSTTIGLGVLVYMASAAVLRVPEYRVTMETFLRRLRRQR